MAGQVLALFADNLAQPLLDLRVADIIVVDPALVAGVVWRINVNALDAPRTGAATLSGLPDCRPG